MPQTRTIPILVVLISLLGLACTPRDPKLLTDQQKQINYCDKKENRSLPNCRELESQRQKVRSKKPFIQRGIEIPYSAHMLSRQSEALRYLQWAETLLFVTMHGGKELNANACLNFYFDRSQSKVIEVFVIMDQCSVSSETETSIVSGTYELILQLDEVSALRQITVKSSGLQTQLIRNKMSVRIQDDIEFSAVRTAGSTVSAQAEYLIKRYEVHTQIINRSNSSLAENTQLQFSYMGQIKSEMGLFNLYSEKMILNWSSQFATADSEVSRWSLKLGFSEKNRPQQEVTGLCSSRQMNYLQNLVVEAVPALSISKRKISIHGREIQWLEKDLKTGTEILKNWQFGKCLESESQDFNLSTKIYWPDLL